MMLTIFVYHIDAHITSYCVILYHDVVIMANKLFSYSTDTLFHFKHRSIVRRRHCQIHTAIIFWPVYSAQMGRN